MKSPFNLFIANNPGGFKALYPVYLQLRKSSYLIITEGIKNLASEGFDELIDYEPNDSEIEKLLQTKAPSLLITATSVASSLGGKLENTFIRHAQKKGIQTLSILDHWCHYVQRYSLENQLDCLPNKIAIMDDKALQDMLPLGFPKERLVITGQPSFDSLKNHALKRQSLLSQRSQTLTIEAKEPVITFVSEPVREDFGLVRGFDQHSVLQDILSAAKQTNFSGKIALKPHPRENAEPYQTALKQSSLFILPDLNPRDLVLSSDLVIGMTSVLLIEAALMDVPTVSYQPRNTPDSPFATMMCPLPFLNSREALIEVLSKPFTASSFPYHESEATRNVVQLINDLNS